MFFKTIIIGFLFAASLSIADEGCHLVAPAYDYDLVVYSKPGCPSDAQAQHWSWPVDKDCKKSKCFDFAKGYHKLNDRMRSFMFVARDQRQTLRFYRDYSCGGPEHTLPPGTTYGHSVSRDLWGTSSFKVCLN
ncbi:hypothetical protein BV22DRAFT_592589 [Leucogyrophana mollusca]|uniref:Uncharacterized protein n=1 Tax=Leucogyrophana mollusca TaxID=85980 RepID=A0ACB8BDE5_9AGAM|nr:hypothetical protein BV22DRAFT_592589 [Leucogyrophana mollusca]